MISEATRERYAALTERVLGTDKHARWLILTHDNPDPDALAAATVLAKILRRSFERRVTVAYGGIIGRAENLEMVRCLRLKLSRVRHLNWKNYQHFALVDSQPQTGNNQLPPDIVPDVVIDHHPLRKATLLSPFRDIREDYGATSTILGEYLLLSAIQPSSADALALVYALRSETLEFLRDYGTADRALYDHFFPTADKRRLGRIQNPRLPLGYFRTLSQALHNLEVVDTLIVCHLGRVEAPEIVPELADLLLRLEGKTWSLCTGLFEERVHLSIRTTNPRAEASTLMRRILGRKGKGGGHGMIAGGWYPLGGNPEQRPEGVQRLLAHRLVRQLKKKPDKLAPLPLMESLPEEGPTPKSD